MHFWPVLPGFRLVALNIAVPVVGLLPPSSSVRATWPVAQELPGLLVLPLKAAYDAWATIPALASSAAGMARDFTSVALLGVSMRDMKGSPEVTEGWAASMRRFLVTSPEGL